MKRVGASVYDHDAVVKLTTEGLFVMVLACALMRWIHGVKCWIEI